MEKEETTIDISFTRKDVNLLLVATTAGLINLNNVQNVLSSVYMNKADEENTKKVMEDIGTVRDKIIAKFKEVKEKEEKEKPFKLELIKP